MAPNAVEIDEDRLVLAGGKAQVGKLDLTFARQDHVFGLDVAVDQTALGSVFERLRNRQLRVRPNLA